MRAWSIALSVSLPLLGACTDARVTDRAPPPKSSGSGQTGAGSGGSASSGSGTGSGSQCKYPTEGLGVEVGEILFEELAWEGYPENESKASSVEVADYLDCNGKDGSNAVLILQVAEWCEICQAEADELIDLMDGDWANIGLRVITLVVENSDGSPSDVDTAKRWKNYFSLHSAVAADPNFTFAQDTTGVPQKILIDPRTMEIVAHKLGALPIDAELMDLVGANSEP